MYLCIFYENNLCNNLNYNLKILSILEHTHTCAFVTYLYVCMYICMVFVHIDSICSVNSKIGLSLSGSKGGQPVADR